MKNNRHTKMPRVLLINPNTSEETTAMMVSITRSALPGNFAVHGVTARHGVRMIATEKQLEASASEVIDCWERMGPDWSGVMVACFGDPGLDRLRNVTDVPVLGICEASMLDAAEDGRRFGVITTTPELAGAIQGQVDALGLAPQYTGLRVTRGDPFALVRDERALDDSLAAAAALSFGLDGAEAVIVGGGPLGHAAIKLKSRLARPLISPIVSAARRLRTLIDARETTF